MSWSAREAGADALLIVNPYYNKGTDDGIVRSFYDAASLGPPVILYNVPARTGSDMSVSLVSRLSEHGNIVAIKEASNVSKVSELIASPECDLHVYSGNDGDTLPAMAVGACGVISVISNIFPEMWVRLCREQEKGNGELCRKIHHLSLPLIRALFAEASPCPVKYLCERAGICGSDVRLPLGDISEKLKKTLETEYDRVHSAQNALLLS
jgi:4-hydroxy-tetrahydrodipicolinate synthase